MVRWPALGVSLLAVLLSSCSGSDPGVQTDEAPPIKVGDCFAGGSAKAIDCTDNHTAQTVYVSANPPTNTSADLSPCREAQARFLGQDFNTRLDVQLWVPEDTSWFRCDILLRNSTHATSGYQVLTESLKGALHKGVPVDLQSCLDDRYDAAMDQPYASCDSPHVSQELIVAPAIGTNTEKFPSDVSDRATRACNASASASHQLVEGHHVAAFYPENPDAWATGERTADCWVTATRGQLPAVKTKTR
ncbi:MAG: septum formation family protein [Nocardioidaceae bacterium]